MTTKRVITTRDSSYKPGILRETAMRVMNIDIPEIYVTRVVCHLAQQSFVTVSPHSTRKL